MAARRLITAAVLLGVLAACGGDEDPAQDPPAPEQTGTAEVPATTEATDTTEATASAPATEDGAPVTAREDETASTTDDTPAEPCGGRGQAQWRDLAGDGSPDAFQLGDGDAAVILLHQNDSRPCNWLPFAETLAAEGYAVLVPVMRSGEWPQPVIGLAAEHLREQGAEHLALVGASMGGTYAIAATPELETSPDLVVAVSAPDFYRGTSARDVVADLALPILFVVAEDDISFVPEAESMAAAATDPDLVILPGAAHGIRLLDTDPEAAQTVLDALHEHAPTD